MRDKVTISLYRTETNDSPGFNNNFKNELANIRKIRDGLINAAIEEKRTPPEIIVSILLIPDWERENNSYEDEHYLIKKAVFLEEAKKHFESINDVKIEDFYSDCPKTPEERAYMHNLKALGSNADMIKTRAIINNADRCRHLQVDSNTIVPSFKELYNQTFNAAEQKDGINASYYDEYYISAHNKMIYTTPEGDIAKKSHLELHLWEWCRAHKDDNNIDQDKNPDKNSIYSRVFTKALREVQYVEEFLADSGKTIYPATLSPKVYWLTDYMVTAINMSWSAERDEGFDELKKLPVVQIGNDGLFNFQCFLNVIKKHTGDLSVHSEALRLNDSSMTGELSRKLLLSISNCDLELKATRDFFINVLKHEPKHINELLGFFENTEEGNALTQKLFGCRVKELPERINSNLLLSSDDIEKKIEQEDEQAASRPGSGMS